MQLQASLVEIIKVRVQECPLGRDAAGRIEDKHFLRNKKQRQVEGIGKRRANGEE